jgi:hypothetical protein
MKLSLSVSLSISIGVGTAPAQLCNSSASFERNIFRALATAGFTENVTGIGGGLGFGGRTTFAELGLQRARLDDVNRSSVIVTGAVGYDWRVGQDPDAHLCAIASIAGTNGPHNVKAFGDGRSFDFSGTALSVGVAIGAAASPSAKIQIVPSGSLELAYATSRIHDDAVGSSSTLGEETFAIVSFGIGVVIEETLSFRGSVSRPFDVQEPSTSVALAVGFGFWRRSTTRPATRP